MIFASLAKLYGWDYVTIGQLTFPQLLDALREGRPRSVMPERLTSKQAVVFLEQFKAGKWGKVNGR